MIFPGGGSTYQVAEVGKRKFFHEPLDGYLAADAAVTINNHFLIRRNICYLLHDLPQRNQFTTQIKIRVFKRLPHINEVNVFFVFEFLFEGFYGDGTHGVVKVDGWKLKVKS